MSTLPPERLRELQLSYRDAVAKLAALPGRQKDEDQQAEADEREPTTIQPLTGIKADALVAAIESIAQPPAELAEILKSQKRACRNLESREVCLLSRDIKAILEAAGIKGSSDANV